MRYDDLSQADLSTEVTVARADVDGLPPGVIGPAIGNTITGSDTITGQAGADSVANPPAIIVAVQGVGPSSAAADGSFVVTGQYGVLTIQADGSYSYVRNTGAPDGLDDVFAYTLADAAGQQSSSTLTIELGTQTPSDAATAALSGIPGVVTLPPGVELSDIRVVGRDLVITLPDGSQMVIPGGAVFVPQLVIGDVEVPASNLAALLIDSEPQPAAGPPLSSGGNFAIDVPPLDPGVPLGDLLPPTELDFTPPEFEEPGQFIDREPTIIIVTPDNPAGAVTATDSVDESGLAARGSEPEGTLEPQSMETTAGTIVFTAEDGLDSVSINGVEVTSVGQEIQGERGTLTITSIDFATGEIGYTYTVTDNTTDGVDDFDDFTVVVTDSDGDTATATLHIDIADDEPIALDDTDTVDIQTNIATGNVMTGTGTTSGAAGADTVGADDAQLTAVSGAGGSDSSFDSDGNLTVEGEYGTLTIDAEGNYTYVLNDNAPGGTVDQFEYTLTDGDGDPVTATLTITNPDSQPTVGSNPVVQLDDDALAGGNPGGTGDDPNAVNTSGTLSGSGGDGALAFSLLATGAPAGFTYVLQANGDLWVMQGSTHVLTATVDSTTGDYTVTQVNPIAHPPGSAENNLVFTINYTVTDVDGDTANGTLSINVDDDTPLANDDTDTVNLQTETAAGNVITGAGTNEGTGNADSPGADGFVRVTGVSSNNVPANSDTTADGSSNYVVAGQYGVLTLNEDGSYTYALNDGAPGGGTEVFTYTYVDGDGDTVTATLTITNPDTQPVVPENVNVALDDDALSDGNPGGTDDDPDATNTSGSVAATGGDGTITYSLSESGAPAGFSYELQANGDLWVMQGTTHVLTVTLDASGDYTVSQVNPIDHPPSIDENNITFTVTFSATDADGDSDSGTFSISVDDDTPLASDDSDSIASGEFGPVTGNVIDNDSPGADGFGQVTGIASDNVPANSDTTADGSGDYQVQGQYGVLTINEDGSYSYLRDAGTPGGVSDAFTYTYVDGDGDPVTATLTIDIGDSAPVANAPDAVIVDDDDVGSDGNPGGTDDDVPANATGTLTATGGDGAVVFFFDLTATEAGLPAGFSLDPASTQTNLLIMQGTTLVMTVTLDSGTGDYTVVQNAPIEHAAGSDENNAGPFDLAFYAEDSDGSQSANQTLTISVDDDTPLASDDSDSIASGEFGPVTGNVIDNDSPGADGFGQVTGIASDNVPANSDTTADGSGDYQVQGQYGVLTINEDGSYSYLRDAGTPGGVSDAFTYTYVDGDGDPVTATLTIDIGDSAPVANAPDAVIVDDDDVGSDGNPGGTDDDVPANATGTLTATGGDGAVVFFFDLTATEAGLPAGFSLDPASTQTNLLIMQGTTLVMTVTLDSGTGDYTVVQNAPIEHAAGSDENNAGPFDLAFYAEDSDGSQSANQTLTISVDDDTPLASDDSDSIASGEFGPVTGNVIDNDSPGADGFGQVTGIASDNVPANSDTTADGSGDYQVQGQYGVLTINEDGSYSYLRDAGTPGGVSDAFTYTYVDGDGDPVTATLTIDIGDSAPVANAPDAVIVDDDDVGSDGNPGGTDDDVPANATGTLTATGGDGAVVFFFDLTATEAGLPAGFSLDPASTQTNLLIMQGTTLVMTVTLDSGTGDYTVVQNAPIEHAAGSDENNAGPFDLAFYAEDSDGSQSANQTLTISVDDDTPLASDDSDSIASGEFGPVTGNVIDNDSPGADGFGQVTGIASDNVPANSDTTADGSGDYQVQGQYGVLTINEDGSYSYLRDAGTPGGVSDAFTYTYVDGDGDPVTATLTIDIGDSAPVANAPDAVIVDDDDVGSDGNPGGTDDDVPANATGTLTATGGDGAVVFFFDLTATEAGLPAGFSLDPASTQTNLLIMQGTTLVMTVTLDSGTGDYTVVQNAPIEHAAGSDENNAGPFDLAFYAEDSDGSQSANQTLTISVDDDTPIDFAPVALTDTTFTGISQDDALVNDGTANVTRLINDTNNDGTGENFIGADGFGSLTFTATGHTDGEQLEDANGNPLTSGGNPVYLFGFGTDTLIASTDPDYDTNLDPNTVVFTATVDEGTGNGDDATYNIDFDQTIDDGSGTVFDDFSAVPAGQNDWVGIDADRVNTDADPELEAIDIESPLDPNEDSEDLLITPTNPGGTINTSATDIGNSNQWIDEGEGIRLDFVTDLRRDVGTDETDVEGYLFDGHYNVTDAGFKIMQTQGGGLASVHIAAFSDSDTGNIKTLSGTPVAIDPSSIEVFDADGGGEIDIIDMGDGTFVITGLEAGDIVNFESVGGAPFNAVEITSAVGLDNPNDPGNEFAGADFALGEFGFTSETQGSAIDLSLDVTATDADGDTSTGTIDVTLVPVGTTTTTMTTLSTESTLSTKSVETGDLLVSNDNIETNKALNLGNNVILFGAMAAAGIMSDPAAASTSAHARGERAGEGQEKAASDDSIVEPQLAPSTDAKAQLISGETKTEASETADGTNGSEGSDVVQSLSVADAQAGSAAEPGNLDQGTDAPQGNASLAAMTADAVIMPSAEMLAVAGNGEAAEQAQSNQIVGQVLADSLAGGSGQSEIDAALSQLPSDNGAIAGLEQLASQDAGAVPSWHSADMAGYSAANDMLSMEALMLHHDAVPVASS